jgi:hypothetical protein
MIVLGLIGLIFFLALIYLPQIWINWTLRKHGQERSEMPGLVANLRGIYLIKQACMGSSGSNAKRWRSLFHR